MLFTSPVFLVFMLVVLAVARTPLPWMSKKAFLLVASYYFYASWNPLFVVLLAASTVVDFFAAILMGNAKSTGLRRLLLIVSLCANLGLLGVFKYAVFFSESAEWVAYQFGWNFAAPGWSIVLPVGISFYTFQTLSYTIDVYRGKLAPTRNFVDFALYVSFFPQLVAGPIVRATGFLPQLLEPKRPHGRVLAWGVLLFIVGLFKKVYLADNIFAAVSAKAYSPGAALNAMEAWAGTYAFAGQIYCDFSGYTDMAIAVALMLGFKLPMNFASPYGALGFSDFWRRWHVSLSSWLREYLYIPLGGNRKGLLRTQFNLSLTMLLGGLWHGANWTFVIWGGLHGVYLMAERLARRAFGELWKPTRPIRVLLILLTFHLVCFAWVFFRAEDLAHASRVVQAMFGLGTGGGTVFGRWQGALACLAVGLLVLCHGVSRGKRVEDWVKWSGWKVAAIVAAVMLFLVLTTGGSGAAFIYFQF
ncbi:MAG: MBOAT family protein [Planctomycetes bacterium]|nr:MBOAT family protein [Planctomycetota bacterium]